jgi:homoserine kinase type II
METAFVLHHVAREDTPNEDVKLIGVYSTRTAAEAAIARMCLLPGFRDYPSGFHIDEYELDRDQWAEGFISWEEASETASS